MRALLFTMMLATAIPGRAAAPEESGIGYPTVASALEALKARSDVNISVKGGWTIVEDNAANAIWSFTPSNHPAHPAAVKRALVSEGGMVNMHMTALCQASKAACDKLIEEFKVLNAQLTESIRSKAARTQQPMESEIAVQRVGDDAYRLVLKSYRSRTVDAGQQELLSKAKAICGAKKPAFGKYEFETREPVDKASGSDAVLALTQNITCGAAADATPASGSAGPDDAKWRASGEQVERIKLQSIAYFAAKDGQRYQEAYGLFTTGQQRATPFAHWKATAENFNHEAGSVLRREIKKITWYKNPPQAMPGIYAAVDFSSQFSNVNIHCGYVVWYLLADGSFRLVREEQNFIDKATEQKMRADQLESVRAQFGCKG